jgi:hypothetical protein
MIHYVPFENPSEDFRVPENFDHRFWYDQEKKCLAYDGVMYKLTFDKIQALHSSYDYRRAVEELFRAAVPEQEQPNRRGHLFAVASGVAVAIVLFVAGIAAWQRVQTDEPLPPAQPTLANDLVGN